MTEETKTAAKPPRRKVKYQLPDGRAVTYKPLKKFEKDMIRYFNGAKLLDKEEIITVTDAYQPLGGKEIVAQASSPICTACGLDQNGCRHPYLEYAGSENPVATIIVESISRREDETGILGEGGSNGYMLTQIYQRLAQHGVGLDEIRLVPLTRCSNRLDKIPNYKTKGNWCRHYIVRDLMMHPPKVVIPIGTNVLGLLSHKSNAGDWSGRMLTWRGWPDDWLTDPNYVLDRPDPLDATKTVRGHILYGPPPNIKIPMVPLQKPGIIRETANDAIFQQWVGHLLKALKTGKENYQPKNYDRPWYRLSIDPQEVMEALGRATRFAESNPDFIVAYDTETTGLKPWAYFKRIGTTRLITANEPGKATAIAKEEEQETTVIRSHDPAIVFMMFRWTNPDTGHPESIGFPWDYEGSELRPHLEQISPHVLKLMSTAQMCGHHLTFDELFTMVTVGRKETEYEPYTKAGEWNPAWLQLQQRINNLAAKARWDTWHMAFTTLQRRGSLGLELLAYDWVPDLAGYEEDMTLLIELHGDAMNPANNKGGHYANCPKEKWETHFKPYVMGDVEVTYQTREKLVEKLHTRKTYKIPLSSPDNPGYFRYYACPSREWVYNRIVSPASRTLTKMMARGMYIDSKQLSDAEINYPAQIQEYKEEIAGTNPVVTRWCKTKLQETEAEIHANPDTKTTPWELDLESKSQLKELLFDTLKCPIVRLTKAGRSLFGENKEDWQHLSYEQQKEFAAVDKYTLNRLAVDQENLRPLQKYRKMFKLYNTYVRTMRNMYSGQLDKKQRQKEPHLSIDNCLHASFLLTGTRSGRLSSRDPNLQQLPNEGNVKKLFASRFRERGCIYAADLSQIELRLMAAACGDATMMKAYQDDIDIHSLTASKIYQVPYETFTKKHMEWLQEQGRGDEAKKLELQRKIAKTTNFLTGYGGGAFGLQNVLANNEVYISIEDCEAIIASFFEAYPALKRFLGVYKTFIDENGCAVSMFGRVRQFEEVYSTDEEAISKALRAGCNHLIQSTASDMMLICLVTIEDLMRQENLRSLLVSTVHDSLVIDTVREELPEVHAIVNGVMNNIPAVIAATLPDYDTSWMTVPFAGDSEVGLNYLEVNKISGDNPDWDKLLHPKKN